MKNLKFIIQYIPFLLLFFFSLGSEILRGGEFRPLSTIAAPTIQEIPEGAAPITTFERVDPELLEEEFRKLCENYTKPELGDYFGDSFYDKDRLLSTISEVVPRDAKLELLSPLRGVQILQQYKMSNPNGGYTLVSIVSVTAQTRLRYNTSTGIRNLDGTHEYILKVEEEKGVGS